MRVFRAAVFCCLTVVSASGMAWAQAAPSGSTAAGIPAKRPMTFADLMAMKRVSDPQISASGKWVLFSVMDVSLEKNTKITHLWIVPLDGSAPERHLVTSNENDATTVTDGRFSPDGKWLMYSKPGSRRLWYAPFDDAAGTVGKEEVITTFNDAHDAIWTPDSMHIVFAMDVYPECESRLPAGAKHNDEELQCNLRKDAEDARNPVKAQVFTSLLYRHWDSYQGPKRSHIFYLPVPKFGAPHGSMMGNVPYEAPTDITPASVIGDHVAPTFSLGGPLGYAISPDGKEVAYVVNLDKDPSSSTNNDVFVWQVGAEPSTARKISTSPGSDDGPAYSPDGRWLAFRSQARAGFESDRFRLMLYDRAAKTIRELMPKFDRWVDEFVWAADSNVIYFAAGDGGEEPVFALNVIDGKPNPLPAKLTDSGEYGELHPTANGSALIATRMTAQGPSEIVRLDSSMVGHTMFDISYVNISKAGRFTSSNFEPLANDQLLKESQLTHLNDNLLSQLDLAKEESFWFTAADGAKVEGFLIRPPGFVEGRKYPLKFVMHGGPQTAEGDAWSYRWNLELLAANGYVVVTINRRGSTGYGQKFIDQVSGDWGGKAYTDLMTGLDYAEKKYPFIDKTRECALGASYGGFMANWVLTHTNRFQCIVTHDGLYDPVAAYGSTEELWFNEREFRPLGANGLVEEGKPGQPWDYAELPASQDPFRKFSPMRFIKNAKTPTLVIHSQLDYRLDVSQGFELFTALQRLGVPSKMLYFPDEGHWVLKPQNSQLWYATVNDWCDRWTHTGKYAGAK